MLCWGASAASMTSRCCLRCSLCSGANITSRKTWEPAAQIVFSIAKISLVGRNFVLNSCSEYNRLPDRNAHRSIPSLLISPKPRRHKTYCRKISTTQSDRLNCSSTQKSCRNRRVLASVVIFYEFFIFSTNSRQISNLLPEP